MGIGLISSRVHKGLWRRRTSELIALRWDDVDLVNRTLTIRRVKVRKREKTPKTKAGRRTVTLHQPTYERYLRSASIHK